MCHSIGQIVSKLFLKLFLGLILVEFLIAPVLVEHELREAPVLNDAVRQPGGQLVDPFHEIHFGRPLRQLR